MFAILLIDHRLALVAFVALLLAAAAPLAYAWARLLPDEPPPFESSPNSLPLEPQPSNVETRRRGDPIAFILLLCITLSFLLKFPGLPVGAVLQGLSMRMPPDDFNYLLLGARIFLIMLPGVAVVYSALRQNAIRLQLILAAVFVMLLWWLSPMLRSAILS